MESTATASIASPRTIPSAPSIGAAADACEPEIAAYYGSFARPKLARFLKAMDLDKVFHRASRNRLYYHRDGREEEVIDFLGGFGSLIVGHNNPVLLKRYKELLEGNVPFVSQMSARRGAALLCRRLAGMFYARFERGYMATLVNSGTEAVEAAIKHAELEHAARRDAILAEIGKKLMLAQMEMRGKGTVRVAGARLTGGPEEDRELGAEALAEFGERLRRLNRKRLSANSVFVALKKSFHGKTSAALSLTHNGVSRKKFRSLGVSAKFVKAGDERALREALETSTVEYLDLEAGAGSLRVVPRVHCRVSAIFAEPIQGEGGIHPISAGFLAAAREAADARGIPLVFDEIQCGMGRTGTFLYSEQLGVEADYYLLSKGLGGGLAKISALLVRRDRYQDEFGFLHTSTFGEDDISSFISLATLDLVDTPESYQSAAEKGEYILSYLRGLRRRFPTVIKDVRGKGLMIGVEFAPQWQKGSVTISTVEQQGHLPGLASGFLLNNFGVRVAPTLSDSNTIRIEPSLTIRKSDCDALFRGLETLCLAIHLQDAYTLTRFLLGKRGVDPDAIGDYRNPGRAPRTIAGLPRVGFIGHCIQPEHMYEMDPSLRGYSAGEVEALMEKVLQVLGPIRFAPVKVVSDRGHALAFQFYGFFVSSRIISDYLRTAAKRAVLVERMEEFTGIAEEDGMRALGFGGFTSIFTNNCKKISSDRLAITSGNSLTVAMGLEAIRKACREKGLDLAAAGVCVVGSLGNISSVYAEAMSLEAGSLLLVGRPNREDALRQQALQLIASLIDRLADGDRPERRVSPLMETRLRKSASLRAWLEAERPRDAGADREALARAVMAELGDLCPVGATTDLMELRRAEVIVAASNSPEPIILPEMIGDALSVICDIAVPSDTDPRVLTKRPGIAYIMGGVVAVPNNPAFKLNGVPLSPGYAYACMCETMTLGFEGVKGGFSYGAISRGQVEEIHSMAASNGFRLGKYKTDTSY